MRKKAIIIATLSVSLLTVSAFADEISWDGAFDAPPAIEETASFDEESAVEEGASLLEDEATFIIEEEVTVDEETATEETVFEAEDTTTSFEMEETEVSSESSSNAGVDAAQDLVYNGEAQALITATEAEENEYSLDGTNFSAEIPTGTNAGEYVVYIKNTAGDEIQTVSVVIAKADVIFTPPVPNTTTE